MNCWICSQPADSREHKVKASDILATFGPINPARPLYLHTEGEPTRKVHGVKSPRIKWGASLCSRCNNQRTQPHDMAWQALAAYLRGRRVPLKKGQRIRLDKAFPGAVHSSMLNVHLFFAKLLGCVIVEESIPVDLRPLADAILQQRAHPYLYLGFWESIGIRGKKQVGATPVVTRNVGGQTVYAGWFYDLGEFAVNVLYAEPGQWTKGLVDSWHPHTRTKVLRIKGP